MDENKNTCTIENKKDCDTERWKRLLATGLGAFIGAFLGSYFVIHQFLLREYKYPCFGMKKPCPIMNIREDYERMQVPPHEFKAKKHKGKNTIIYVISDEKMKELPFDDDLDFDDIMEKMMLMR